MVTCELKKCRATRPVSQMRATGSPGRGGKRRYRCKEHFEMNLGLTSPRNQRKT